MIYKTTLGTPEVCIPLFILLLALPSGVLAQVDARSIDAGVNAGLNAISFVNGQLGLIVGNEGTILRSDDGGESWERMQSPTKRNLYDVSFVNDREAYAVGAGGSLLYTGDAGRTWRSIDFDKGVDFRSVRMFNDHTGIIVGSLNFGNSTMGKMALISAEGIRWHPDLPDDMHGFTEISFRDALNGYAVGACMDLGPCEVHLARTSDGGGTWTFSASGIFGRINSIHFADERRGFAVGNHGALLRSDDGGQSWQVVESGRNVNFHAIRFTDRNTGYILCSDASLLHSTDGGSSWQSLALPKGKGLTALGMTPEGIAFAVGPEGMILKLQGG